MKFDLTTKEGRQKVYDLVGVWGWALFPAAKIYDLLSPEDTIKAQKEAAVDIIKSGRDNNVDSIEITLDQKAGLDLGGTVDGVPINVELGKSGKMTIKVKYKDMSQQ